MAFPSVSTKEARAMGIHVRATELTFNISNTIRQTLGNNDLKAEILAAPSRIPTRPNIIHHTFNAQSDVARITGLRSNAVYNVRFFMMTGLNNSKREFFVNTLIKTGMAALTLHSAILS